MVSSATPVTSPVRARFGSPASASTASPAGLAPRRDRDVPPISTFGLRDRHLSPTSSSAGLASSSALAPQHPGTSSTNRTPLAIQSAPPTAAQSAAISHRRHASTPTPGISHSGGLLVPTDRPLDEFEVHWLPRLGRLRVDREVEMCGYALYGIRSWYLSRTHWSLTIAAYTGKPTDVVSSLLDAAYLISCYVLVPAAGLSAEIGTDELRAATQMLAAELRAKPSKTDDGTLLVSAPTLHGQEIWPIPQGDLREAWPFIVLNTALRRLGCGGRAAMGNDAPVAAVRRKLYELYRIPVPSSAKLQGSASRAGSPQQSPIRSTHSRSQSLAFEHARQRSIKGSPRDVSPSSEEIQVVTAASLERDPLMLSTVELVKLIQGGLALWGFYGAQHEEIELDGLFCDETKAGIANWRTAMGMEQEENLKLEKETSGGCIDPRTLAVLLSSVTSSRYLLGALNVERLPKDPFQSVRRFLSAWRNYQTSVNSGKPSSPFLSVQGIRQLNACYVVERKGHASDALKVHRILFSSVGSVASGVQSVVKGSANNDESMPARKREQHIRFTGREEDSGISMIVPSVGGAAAPDVITSDLEAYVKGVLKSREKDWDVMGARRIADLWSGRAAEADDSRAQPRLRVFGRRSNLPIADDEDDTSLHLGTTAIGTIRGAAGAAAGAATGAIKGITKGARGGLRVVGRRQLPYDTSDSESGRHVLSSAQSYARRNCNVSASPSTPLAASSTLAMNPVSISPSLPHQSTRFHNSDSDAGWDRSPDLVTRRRSVATTVRSVTSNTNTMSPDLRGRRGALVLMRMASDGADVIAGPNDAEWAVANGRGSGKRIDESADTESVEAAQGPEGVVRVKVLRRSQSFQADRRVYRTRHVSDPTHLAIDVAMCEVVWELRKRERMLAKRADDMSVLERSAFTATEAIFDTARLRRERIEELESKVAQLRDKLSHASGTAVQEDKALKWANDKITYKKQGDVNTAELHWQLRNLATHYETMRAARDKRTAETDVGTERLWWWPWS
ncbi:hypothetical protein CcaverHIS002_0204240 [Cutaneotrichosporon cavernicola]|nr:hypothetical protein CcaverHIS002_0204240 [Cutaneotrichosporon cavernicola]